MSTVFSGLFVFVGIVGVYANLGGLRNLGPW